MGPVRWELRGFESLLWVRAAKLLFSFGEN